MVAFRSKTEKQRPMKPEKEKAQSKSKIGKGGRIIGGNFYQKMASGGRIGLKAGSTGCKLAMKGKGKAYGKNS